MVFCPRPFSPTLSKQACIFLSTVTKILHFGSVDKLLHVSLVLHLNINHIIYTYFFSSLHTLCSLLNLMQIRLIFHFSLFLIVPILYEYYLLLV